MAKLGESFDRFNCFGTKATNTKTFENSLLFVNWNLGNQCTYKCSYCAKECHDGSFPWPSIDESIKTVDTLNEVYKRHYNKKKIYFELLGGEVTLWKDFDKLSKHILYTQNELMLVSNGVRSAEWWEQRAKLFRHVTLSFHPEFADPQHLAKVYSVLRRSRVSSTILLLMHPKRWEDCVAAYRYFASKTRQKDISIQKLNFLPTSKLATEIDSNPTLASAWPYSPDQMQWMQEHSSIEGRTPVLSLFNKSKMNELGNIYFLKHSKQKSNVVPNSYLLSRSLNSWKGWNCYVGIDTLSLEQNGDVKRSVMCRVEPPLGSWRKVDHLKKVENLGSIVWPHKPVVCPYGSCNCSHDFKARKEKPTKSLIPIEAPNLPSEVS